MENAFDLLEEKVRKAAELVRQLRKEKHALQDELSRSQARLGTAEKKLAALEKVQGAATEQALQAEALSGQLKALTEEREEIRSRIGRLVELLEGLD